MSVRSKMANFQKVFCDPSNHDLMIETARYLTAEEYFDLCDAFEGCLYRDIAISKLDKLENDEMFLKFFCNDYKNKKFHNFLKSIMVSEFDILNTIKNDHFEYFNKSDVEDFFIVREEEADDEYMIDETDPDLIFYQGLKKEIRKNPGSWWEFVDFAKTRYFLYDIVFWYDFQKSSIFNDIIYNCCWCYFACEEGEFLFNENYEADRAMELLFFETFNSGPDPKIRLGNPHFTLDDFENIFEEVYAKYFDRLDEIPLRERNVEIRDYQEDEFSDEGFHELSSQSEEEMDVD